MKSLLALVLLCGCGDLAQQGWPSAPFAATPIEYPSDTNLCEIKPTKELIQYLWSDDICWRLTQCLFPTELYEVLDAGNLPIAWDGG